MKRNMELFWLCFLMLLWLGSSILLFDLSLEGVIDIQLHDTYYVIKKNHFFFFVGGLLMTVYLFGLTLKRMAAFGRFFRFASVLLSAIIALVLFLLFVLFKSTSPFDDKSFSEYGILVLTIGLGFYFGLRSVEFSKVRSLGN